MVLRATMVALSGGSVQAAALGAAATGADFGAASGIFSRSLRSVESETPGEKLPSPVIATGAAMAAPLPVAIAVFAGDAATGGGDAPPMACLRASSHAKKQAPAMPKPSAHGLLSSTNSAAIPPRGACIARAISEKPPTAPRLMQENAIRRCHRFGSSNQAMTIAATTPSSQSFHSPPGARRIKSAIASPTAMAIATPPQ